MACLLVFAVQIGVQNLPSLLSGELFTSDVRPMLKGFTRSFTCVMLMICLKSFPLLESHLHLYGTFYLYAAVLFVAFPAIYLIVPETKDLGLEVIQEYFLPPRTVFYVDIDTDSVKDTTKTKEISD
jgi:hypothetical protein